MEEQPRNYFWVRAIEAESNWVDLVFNPKKETVLSREISGTGRSRQKMASSPAQNYFIDTLTTPVYPKQS